MTLRAIADAVKDLGRRLHADIGAEQCVLEFVQQVRVDLAVAGEVFDAAHQSRARFFDARLQFVEQCWLLFHRAKQGLNHAVFSLSEKTAGP